MGQSVVNSRFSQGPVNCRTRRHRWSTALHTTTIIFPVG